MLPDDCGKTLPSSGETAPAGLMQWGLHTHRNFHRIHVCTLDGSQAEKGMRTKPHFFNSWNWELTSFSAMATVVSWAHRYFKLCCTAVVLQFTLQPLATAPPRALPVLAYVTGTRWNRARRPSCPECCETESCQLTARNLPPKMESGTEIIGHFTNLQLVFV